MATQKDIKNWLGENPNHKNFAVVQAEYNKRQAQGPTVNIVRDAFEDSPEGVAPKALPILPNLDVPKQVNPMGLGGGNYQNRPEYVQGSNEGRASSTANALRYGLPVAAMIAGGPGAGAMARAGTGAISGLTGESAAQGLEVSTGERDRIAPGEIVASTMVSTIPGGGIWKDAAVNATAETVRSLIDTGELPEAKQLAIATLAGSVTGGVIDNGRIVSSKVFSRFDELAKERDVIFRKLKKSGFKINPDGLRDVGLLNWLAGKSQINSSISKNNQVAAQRLARESIGLKGESRFRKKILDPETALVKDKGELGDLMVETAEPYARMRKISEDVKEWSVGTKKDARFDRMTHDEVKLLQSAEDTLDELKVTRSNKTKAFEARNADPEALGRFRELQARESALELKIENIAGVSGDETLLKDIIGARRRMAKIFAVINATDPTNGMINTSAFASQLDAGVPLTGGLRDMADFSRNFPQNTLNVVQAMADDPANLSMRLGTTSAASGNAAGTAASFSMPFAGRGAKSILTSDIGQALYAKPNSSTLENALGKGIRLIGNQEARGDSRVMDSMIEDYERKRQEQGR
tara:strand:+ start:906 stop:2651 length:1746 start_codon:yes stop_codon:yes gene_type:complete